MLDSGLVSPLFLQALTERLTASSLQNQISQLQMMHLFVIIQACIPASRSGIPTEDAYLFRACSLSSPALCWPANRDQGRGLSPSLSLECSVSSDQFLNLKCPVRRDCQLHPVPSGAKSVTMHTSICRCLELYPVVQSGFICATARRGTVRYRY
ncbi:hypothetical protein F5884DRAFT_176045 [Xylogone sp. PMI_703]|nr:hypothetical protein F5884DRAFT_176045 [Xylogone sp. PMI_703]